MSSKADRVLALQVTDQPLHEFAIHRMRGYGTYVIENRALPDYRDGLKPVQRKILYVMHDMSPRLRSDGPTVKSARVIGEVMGKYHPHGDLPIYEASVAMVNMPQQLIHGQGNFGAFNGKQAAMRYTEMRLAKYSEQLMLSSDYMAITPTMLNYDGSLSEPIFLPALLPNLLFNGVSGIAVGVAVNIPPFKPDGVMKLVRKALRGGTVTPRNCMATLQIHYPKPFNSKIITSDEDLLDFYKTGRGRLTLAVDYTINGNEMTITKFPPYFSMDKAKITLLEKVAEVASADDYSDKTDKIMVVRLKSSVELTDRRVIFEQCVKLLNNYINLQINFIERIDDEKVKYRYCNMPQLIHRWVNWRVKLEKRVNKWRRRKLRKEISHLRLLILACDNLDKLVVEVKRKADNLDQRVAQTLSITEEQAKIILGVTVRRLSAMSRTELAGDIKTKQNQITEIEGWITNPAEKILMDLPRLTVDLI
jgi:DNA gyrase/topoisomerase IV subunit A